MGIKVRKLANGEGWVFHCPGCDSVHQCDGRWSFNGNVERPTFGPVMINGRPSSHSILVSRPHLNEVCHSFVTDGRISFVPDSTHALKGQEVELPDWDTRHGPNYGGIKPHGE